MLREAVIADPELRLLVTRPYQPPRTEFDRLLDEIWASGFFTNEGPLAVRLAAQLRDWLDLPSLQLVSSGAAALRLALDVFRLRGSVVTTPFTFAASAHAIALAGLRPIFADIDPDTLCLDPDCAEAAIEADTVAMLATHVFGIPCAVDAFDRITADHGLKMVYDGAHAFGTTLRGRSVLGHGDATALSFHATKPFHTVEGGAVVTRDPHDAEWIRVAKAHGIEGMEVPMVGTNAKLSEVHAAFGLIQLPRMTEQLAERDRRFGLYRDALAGGAARLLIPTIDDNWCWNHAYCPVLFPSESAVLDAKAALRARGIDARRYFYPALNTLPYYAGADCPIAEDVSRRILCLAFGHGIRDEEVVEVADVVARSR